MRQLEEREKRAIRRFKGIKRPFDQEQVTAETPIVTRVRDFNAPFCAKYIKPRRGRCVLSHEKRLVIFDRAEARLEMRRELAAVIDGSKRELPL